MRGKLEIRISKYETNKKLEGSNGPKQEAGVDLGESSSVCREAHDQEAPAITSGGKGLVVVCQDVVVGVRQGLELNIICHLKVA